MDCANLSDQRECLRDQGTGPSPQSGKGGRPDLESGRRQSYGESVFISKLTKKRVTRNIDTCVRITVTNRCALSLPASSYHRALKRATATDTATSARGVLSVLSVPDVMTADEMDDFGM